MAGTIVAILVVALAVWAARKSFLRKGGLGKGCVCCSGGCDCSCGCGGKQD